MINDHSEVMSTIQAKISALNAALNDKKYEEAAKIASDIKKDMTNIYYYSILK